MIRYETCPAVGIEWHPFADIFPWIEGPAFDDFKEDIRRNGVREPIVFLGNKILDGRNRYTAARELGIEYPRVDYEGDDPLGFVISVNLKRRHLTESQRAMVATRLAKLEKGRPEEDKSANLRIFPDEQPASPKVTQAEAARMLNVSERSIQTARKVEQDGAPELVAAVDAGAVSVSAAAQIVTLPKPQQTEIVAQGPAAVKEAAAELREAVKEAAAIGIKGAPAPSNKNPLYKAPSKAGSAWTYLYGECRALNEWATDENVLLALHGMNERTDDQSANLNAIRRTAEVLNNFLESVNAQ